MLRRASRDGACLMCPNTTCYTRKAADLALGGRRPYLDGCCVVCNYVIYKSREAKDGTKFLEAGRRRPAKRVVQAELDAAYTAGAISAGSAVKFWKATLWELVPKGWDPEGWNPNVYVRHLVFPPGRQYKEPFIYDVAWKFCGVRSPPLCHASRDRAAAVSRAPYRARLATHGWVGCARRVVDAELLRLSTAGDEARLREH